MEIVDEVVSTFYKSLNNVNFNIEQNGELNVLDTLKLIDPQCFFDVGANKGDWALLTTNLYPRSTFHAFEIVPSTYMELKRNTENHPNILTNNFGLSDEVQTIIMNLGEDSSTATAFKMSGMKYHDTYYTQEIEGTLRKASDYVKENHILSIDYLKIDTEGMDLKVIKGFEDTINLVRVIQFEYGIFNIASHDLLYDIFQYLNSYNFTVGKIFPRYVKFLDYHFDQENFYGGNYLAVKKDDKELLAKLQLRATS